MRIFILISLLLLAFPSWAEPDTAVVIEGTRVNLRSGRADTYRIIKSLEPGTRVEVVREESGYMQVKTSSGETGWLPSRMLKVEESKAESETSGPTAMDLQAEITKLRTELVQSQKQQPRPASGMLWWVWLAGLVTGVLVGMGGLRAYYLKRLKGLRI